MESVIIAGGSGLIGSELASYFKKKHVETFILTRAPSNIGEGRFHWNPSKGIIDERVFDKAHAVINLAGSPLFGKRWTKSVKNEIYHSRINSSRFLVHTISRLQLPIAYFVQVSAMGYYGHRSTEVNEDSEPGSDFLSKLWVDWENQLNDLPSYTHKAVVRVGLYLSPNGGILDVIGKLARFGLATGFGKGNQLTNYTHRDELNELVYRIVHHDVPASTYNAVGPRPITTNDFIRNIAHYNNSKVYLPNIPSWALKIALGDAAQPLLNNTPIVSNKMKDWGLQKFKSMEEALSQL